MAGGFISYLPGNSSVARFISSLCNFKRVGGRSWIVAGGFISYLPGNSSVASRSESMKGSFVLNLMRSVGHVQRQPHC